MDYKTIFKRKIPILIVVALIFIFSALSSCFGEMQTVHDGKTHIAPTAMHYEFTHISGGQQTELTALINHR